MLLNTSYSSLELVKKCPRKFELEKLLVPEGLRDDSLDLVCGSATGIGIQTILEGRGLERAVYEAMIKWTLPNHGKTEDMVTLQETSRSLYETNKKKTFYFVVWHLERFAYGMPDAMQGWKLWTLPNGRPATEVGFRIALPNGSFHRGFIDGILYRDVGAKREYATLEIKTSGFSDTNPAIYQNTEQGNSYSFIVDYITKQVNPITFYLVLEFPKVQQICFDFWKSPADKISWLPALALQHNIIDMYQRANHFPMNGAACFDFFKPCKHLGTCNLSRSGNWIPHKQEPDSVYDYNFSLAELLKVKEELYGS